MKKLIIAGLVCFVVLSALYLQEKSKPLPVPVLPTEQEESVVVTDYKNTNYVVDGENVLLIDGVSEVNIPDSSAKTFTKYFGNDLRKDLNDDGREDVVFLITRETGGSGTFFYVVAALDTPSGYVGSYALFLGDRIAPQNIVSGEGKQIIVNYAERLPEESFAVPPSVGKSMYLLLDVGTMQFGEVVQEFEGEANPDAMTLQMKTWNWAKAELSDGTVIEPKIINKFTITFTNEGDFSATTDCNNIGGSFIDDNKNLSFGEMMMTMMYCDGSQEAEFSKLLNDTISYRFTNKGELILNLKADGGTVTFK